MNWRFIFLVFVPNISGQCLEYDSKPPKCEEWIGEFDEPVFIEHVFNCSRFWVCQPDLTDCLHECARADENSALYFDVRYQYPYGPVCDWPTNIDCINRPIECGQCEVWQDCVELENGYICTPDCHIDPHCNDDEYCDYPDGGEGNCHIGCRNNSTCGVNSKPCGTCTNHICQEPECCTDEDCQSNEKCIEGKCDFECLTDDDCEFDEYCSNGECLQGCNEDQDCTNTICSICDIDHQCTDPQCCVDEDCHNDDICTNGSCVNGCRENSDCTMNGICAECMTDNQCSKPECCVNEDCDASKPICIDDHICIPGCIKDEDCSGFDETCNNDYSNCFFCNMTIDFDYGNCSPGCVDDKNCANTQVCNGFHRCSEEGSTKNLRQIILKTEKCINCEETQVETGPILFIIGGQNTVEVPNCTTFNLDHEKQVDYTNNAESIFIDQEDKDVLGTCYKANLQGEIQSGKITWTAKKGKWSLKKNQIDFSWSDVQACKYTCCLDKPFLDPENNIANFIDCEKNCQDNKICNILD